MSYDVDKALINSYRAGIQILTQQKRSKLGRYVRRESQKSEFDFHDRIGATDVIEVQGRHTDTPLVSTPHDRRRTGLRDFDWADMIDRRDKIRMLSDPTSPYSMNAVMAFNRKEDDLIIEAATATAYTGKDGSTQVAFPTSTNQIAHGNKNMTVAKLKTIRQFYKENDVIDEDSGEMPIVVLSPDGMTSLLDDDKVTSSEYNQIRALVAGEVNTFLGLLFVQSNRLSKTGNIRSALSWAPGGMLLAIGEELVVDIGPRRDKRNSIQIYVSKSMDATRMEEVRVLEVLCDESVSGP